ncbi:MAG: Probable disulfide formation protein [uncultured Thiotrichaceae bacterium]|uniref:Probable disulfide formation protein n=1 Tax=uncultured Thiotrichaceae bacterium TaxID=298394 RepID=A0A6S6S765_9GAMM|nr:MAG: Probable disulfide formation protein [uncultured Thiotrichaceae bacterium]
MASRHVFSALMPVWLYAAWFIALTATLGALFIGEVLGQTPCVLCWYQRIAMFPLAWILGVACLTNDLRIVRYALPLALAGGAIALWHSLLYAGIVKEAIVPCQQSGPSCTDSAMLTVADLPIPYLSLISFVAIAILLVIFHFHNKSPKVTT